MRFHISAFIAIAILFSSFCLTTSAQRPDGKGKPDSAKKEKKTIKPYGEVITKDAKSSAGLFLVHQLDEKVFYEIPTDKLGKDMLWVTQIEKTQAGYSNAGMPVGDRVVRWELRGEKILLRDVKYTVRADVDDPIKQAVAASSVAPIIQVFQVAAWGTDKKPVIDVTSLFTSDISEFSPKNTLNASSIDSKKTFVENIKSFPENINTSILATYKLNKSSPSSGAPRRSPAIRRDPTQSSITIVLNHSMRELPDVPMKPRKFDSRVGFFTVGFQDFGNNENHQVESVRLITRWRVEKKDPNAKVSEVKKPIVFYVGRGVPKKWRSYVKKGIEMWQPAFEAAGFKNAIIGKIAPTEQEDPNWDPEDCRISTIRWLPSMTENAFGPHVHDPRTGEILEADVRIYHNVLKLCRDWYFVQASPNDKRAQKLPLPDDLVGELLAYVVAHEVGHSIGFPHNMKASNAYTVENLRDPEFTRKYGTESSIMDYGRFNYVAQPGDGANLIPTVGPYDFFAINWGYGEWKDSKTEKAELAKLVAKQKNDAKLRFGNADPREDPTRQTEDLGSDAILATELGLKNIDRVAEFLVSACCSEGKNYDLLQNMYEQLINQRTRELMHVTGVVAGFEEINLFYGDAERRYHPIETDKQKRAIEFLLKHAFQTNKKLIDPKITMRLEASGAPNRILKSQRTILQTLISESRVNRMSEHVERSLGESENADVYTPSDMLKDLRKGIWNELVAEPVKVDLYRRNLQRTHIEVLSEKVKSKSSDSDLPALCRAELTAIQKVLNSIAPMADKTTLAHIAQLKAQIDAALDPKFNPAKAEPTRTPARRR